MTTSHETILDVEGMSCSSCQRHVEKAVGALAGVGAVHVDLATGRVRVVHDPAQSSVEAMVRAIDDAGYTARAAR